MYYDLNKREKKIARQLIDKGLDTAFANALNAAESIIENWHAKKLDNRDAYLQLFKIVNKHDNDIARRYDRLTGSKYLVTVAQLFSEKIISEEDISGFSEETKQRLYLFKE